MKASTSNRIHFEDVVREADIVFDKMNREIQKRAWKVVKKGGTLVSSVGAPPQ